jgi:hypothetical protein
MQTCDNGCTRAFGRHLVVKRVVIAAAAVLLFTSHAQANPITFRVDTELSWLNQTRKLVGPALGGSKTGTAQFTGSDRGRFYGNITVDMQDTTIQLMPGPGLWALTGAPGEGGVPGLYAPLDPVTSNPSSGSPGFNPNSNYGLAVAAIGEKLVQYGVRIDIGAAGTRNGFPYSYPSTPMALTGQTFNLAGQAMSFTAGREAFVSGLGPGTRDLTGDLFLLFGTAVSDIGSFDYSTALLTLPVHSSVSRVLTTDFGGITEYVDVTGQLVLFPVPEPSTIAILSFGVIALLGYGRSARKRRAR